MIAAIDPDILAFSVLAVMLAITPGADTMIVFKNAADGGTRRGLLTMAGVKMGTAVHALLAGVGVATILIQFSAAYTTLKLVGAAYLVWLGFQSIYRGWKPKEGRESQSKPAGGKALAEGFLSNILNPKVVLFYVAVLPQFVGPNDDIVARSALLASIHIAASIIWLTLVSAFVGTAQRWLENPRVKRTIDTVSGLAIAAFGVKLALSSRP